MTAMVLEIFLYEFEVVYELQLVSYSHKTVPQSARCSSFTLIWLLFMYSGHGMYSQPPQTTERVLYT